MKSIPGNTGPAPTALTPNDSAPAHVARNITIDYPRITKQPEHIAAHAKLQGFVTRKVELQEQLKRLQAEHASRMEAQRSNDRKANDIDAADALLSGARQDSGTEQMQAIAADIAVLDRAETAQRQVLKQVSDDLSRQAGQHFVAQHKAEVARLREAIQALHAANKAEAVIRDDLVALGYTGGTVAYMGYGEAHDPSDNTGSPAFYWFRDAAAYIQTAGQKETAARKSRIASLIG
jgi:hypothetical protein